MINRQQAFVLIKKYIKSEKQIRQSLITEAILKKIAKILGTNEELWGLTGLLYNIDYDYTLQEPEKRGIFAAQLLEGLLPECCINAIKSINYQHSDYIPSSSLDKSMVATVAFTDFITAVYGSTSLKDIKEVNIELLKNKLLESNFTNINLRSRILLCNDIGIDLKDFLEIGINTLREI